MYFLPACDEKDISGQVFSRWRCKQKLSYAFSWSLASLHKKIQLSSLIFAHFDTKIALRGKKVKFREKTRKVNFLILDPLCDKWEKWFFLIFSLFLQLKWALKRRLAWLKCDFLLAGLRKEAVDFACTYLPTTGGSEMRKFSAIKINCTLNMYFPRPRLKRRTFLDWPPSGGRGNVHESVVFAIFLVVVGSNPGGAMKQKSAIFSFFFLFFTRKSQITTQSRP